MRGPGVYVGPGRVFSAPLSTWRRRRSDRRRGKKSILISPSSLHHAAVTDGGVKGYVGMGRRERCRKITEVRGKLEVGGETGGSERRGEES